MLKFIFQWKNIIFSCCLSFCFKTQLPYVCAFSTRTTVLSSLFRFEGMKSAGRERVKRIRKYGVNFAINGGNLFAFLKEEWAFANFRNLRCRSYAVWFRRAFCNFLQSECSSDRGRVLRNGFCWRSKGEKKASLTVFLMNRDPKGGWKVILCRDENCHLQKAMDKLDPEVTRKKLAVGSVLSQFLSGREILPKLRGMNLRRDSARR